MADDIDLIVIKKTQEVLGSVIKKPVLTEKSLKKPPFRFLHDVIANVIKTSGFLKGLYTAEELHSDNVKDKESKVLFLQKAIDALSIVTKQSVNLKPTKVVAGHDPQKTNLFLQILGTAVKNKLDSKEAVEKVLSERVQGSPVKIAKDRRASVDKRRDKDKAHARSLTKTLDPVKKTEIIQKETSKSKDDKSKEKTKESKRDREKSRDRARHKSDDVKKASREKVSKSKEVIQKEEEKIDINDENEIVKNPDANVTNEEQMELLKQEDSEMPNILMNGESHINEQNEIEATEDAVEKPLREKSHRPHSSRSARPPSARSKRTKPSDENDSAVKGSREPLMATSATIMGEGVLVPEQSFENILIPTTRPPSARPPSARPSSSRPAPPRIRIRHVVDNEENNFRPATAKLVENVIIDQPHQSEDEEEETFILMENEQPENLEINHQDYKTLPAETPEDDKGSLVKKLLETKKDLEGGSQHTPTKKVEIDKSQMSDAARNRERDSASKELGQLRNFVQSLSKTAVPLGRMLDFLQEDLDAMKMELKMWKEEHAQNLTALHKEQSATESLLEPLRAQLDDLDQVVQNQLDANSALKSSISRNDERIQRMLSSVNHKS